MADISNRQDLEFLLSAFYARLLEYENMRHIFVDVARIDIDKHLPVITDFWEQILFGTADYKKNVMQLHVALNERVQLSAEDFGIWLNTFEITVDNHFRGENSEKIKTRALSIATIMQVKLRKT